jgi:pimeloyl-ACP methyl ester carboxylesterase
MIFRPLRQWWTQSSYEKLLHSQDKLFQTLLQKHPFTKHKVAGLNSVSFANPNAVGDTTVILAHGFGSGLGFFFANVQQLLQQSSVRNVVLVDWMGMGGSDRPACRARPIRGLTEATTSWCDSRFTPAQAVKFFIDPFHEWMQQRQQAMTTTGRTILLGHSLGGYLAARYMLEYGNQSQVDSLVLASPVGFPVKPDTVLVGRQLPTSLRIVDTLWSSNFTPQQLVRMMGSRRGRTSTQRALMGRIPHLQKESVELLAEYLYHITVAKGSGEFAMNSLLEPVVSTETMGIYAREPLQVIMADHLEKQFKQGATAAKSLSSIKVLFGDHDWMRPNEPSARETMNEVAKQTGIRTSVEVIPNAGHHLYLDNSIDFTRHLLSPPT